ncbi:MAG: hypothetical protein ACREN2_11590 [Candidatus Dormibacteria bacterium]
MIAHVLSGSAMPIGVEWLAAVLLFGGFVAAVAVRRRWWRRAAAAVALVGLAVTVTGFVFDTALPGPAPYGLRILAPLGRTPPDAVITVCGVRGDGALVTPTDGQHWLVPFIDGRQVPAIDASVLPERLSPGPHSLRFDLVTPSMREFTPAASVTEELTVDAAATPSGPGRC